MLPIFELDRSFDRGSFDCGDARQNNYLQKLAIQHQNASYSQTYVYSDGDKRHIHGFITLSPGSVLHEDIDPDISKRLPKLDMPVLFVGQLATDVRSQGKGVGSSLLLFAMKQLVEHSPKAGAALKLCAQSEEVAQFYERRGFVRLMPGKLQLFVSVREARRALEIAAATEV